MYRYTRNPACRPSSPRNIMFPTRSRRNNNNNNNNNNSRDEERKTRSLVLLNILWLLSSIEGCCCFPFPFFPVPLRCNCNCLDYLSLPIQRKPLLNFLKHGPYIYKTNENVCWLQRTVGARVRVVLMNEVTR